MMFSLPDIRPYDIPISGVLFYFSGFAMPSINPLSACLFGAAMQAVSRPIHEQVYSFSNSYGDKLYTVAVDIRKASRDFLSQFEETKKGVSLIDKASKLERAPVARYSRLAATYITAEALTRFAINLLGISLLPAATFMLSANIFMMAIGMSAVKVSSFSLLKIPGLL